MGTYLSTPVVDKGKEEGIDEGNELVWGVVDMQGWRKSMEDAHVAQTDVKYNDDQIAKVFGVFDGHGGPEVARFCQLYLIDVLCQQHTWGKIDGENVGITEDLTKTAVGQALVESFHALDRMIDDRARRAEIGKLQTEKTQPGERRKIGAFPIPPLQPIVGDPLLSTGDTNVAPRLSTLENEESVGPSVESSGETEGSDGNRKEVEYTESIVQVEDMHEDSETTDSASAEIEKTNDIEATPRTLEDSDDVSESTTAESVIQFVLKTAPSDEISVASSGLSIPSDEASSTFGLKEVQLQPNVQADKHDSSGHVTESPEPVEERIVLPESSLLLQTDDGDADDEAVDGPVHATGQNRNNDDDDDNDDDGTPDDDSEKQVITDESIMLDQDLMTGGDTEDKSDSVPQGKVTLMFNKLMKMGTKGSVIGTIGGANEQVDSPQLLPPPSPPSNRSKAIIPTIIQNGRQICNLPDHPIHAGCTAVVAVKVGNVLTVANAGDSRAVLCRLGGRAEPLSFDHKPQQDREMNRITNAGGFVNQFGRVNGNLNLSRSIGDLKYKQVPGIAPADQMITAEPDIVQVTLHPKDEFMILGCDGIFDCLTNDQAISYVRDRIDTKPPTDIGEEMLDEIISDDPRATQGIGGDNMTIMIVDFQPQSRSYNHRTNDK